MAAYGFPKDGGQAKGLILSYTSSNALHMTPGDFQSHRGSTGNSSFADGLVTDLRPKIGVKAIERHGGGPSTSCSKYAIPEPRHHPCHTLPIGTKGLLRQRNLGHETKHANRPSISRFGMQSILRTCDISLMEEVGFIDTHFEAYLLIFH